MDGFLLNTIHIPRNIKQLADRLPRSNYDNDQKQVAPVSKTKRDSFFTNAQEMQKRAAALLISQSFNTNGGSLSRRGGNGAEDSGLKSVRQSSNEEVRLLKEAGNLLRAVQ
jgi:hypothetical protein